MVGYQAELLNPEVLQAIRDFGVGWFLIVFTVVFGTLLAVLYLRQRGAHQRFEQQLKAESTKRTQELQAAQELAEYQAKQQIEALYERLINELQGQINSAATRITNLENDNAELKARDEVRLQRIVELTKDIEALQREAAEARRDREAAEDERDAERQQVRELRQQFKELQKSYEQLNALYQKTVEERNLARKDLDAARLRIDALERKLATIEKKQTDQLPPNEE